MAVAKHFAKRRKFFLREFLRERLILQEFYKDLGEIFAVYLAMLQKFNIIFLIFLSKYCNNSKIFTNFAPNLGISYLEIWKKFMDILDYTDAGLIRKGQTKHLYY